MKRRRVIEEMERGSNCADGEEERRGEIEGSQGSNITVDSVLGICIGTGGKTKEVEKKGLIPESQAGFRKEKGIIDNIYYINYLLRRKIGRGGKIVAALVDFKAAFDSVDREI